MTKQINFKNIAIGTLASFTFNASIGYSLAYFLEFNPVGGFLAANLLCHIPMSIAVSDALRQELGLKSPMSIVGNWTGRPASKVKVSANGKSRDIFMSMLPSGLQPALEENHQLDTITIFMNGERYDVPFHKIEEFVYSAYSRQRQKKSGLSRRYWAELRRPTITTLDYNLMMKILSSVDGLIINRSEKRSGQIATSPREALKLIKETF